jgi:hypothetical protein
VIQFGPFGFKEAIAYEKIMLAKVDSDRVGMTISPIQAGLCLGPIVGVLKYACEEDND